MSEPVTEEARLSSLLEETAALFALHGCAVNEDVTRYLVPLLAGEQDFCENRAMLRALMERRAS